MELTMAKSRREYVQNGKLRIHEEIKKQRVSGNTSDSLWNSLDNHHGAAQEDSRFWQKVGAVNYQNLVLQEKLKGGGRKVLLTKTPFGAAFAICSAYQQRQIIAYTTVIHWRSKDYQSFPFLRPLLQLTGSSKPIHSIVQRLGQEQTESQWS